MSKLITDGGDCRTAPATPGLLIIMLITKRYCPMFPKTYIFFSFRPILNPGPRNAIFFLSKNVPSLYRKYVKNKDF